jgi:hypothetical protein
MTLTPCMGGWCTRRDHCAHFHAASEHHQPAERLCPPGHDGVGLQTLEHIDMTRPYISAELRRQQALEILRDGITIAEIRDALGYASNENATRVMDALVYAGQAFHARAKADPESGGRAWTTHYFKTAEARDAYVKAKDKAIAERKSARKKATANRMPYYIKRNAERKAARQARVQEDAAKRAAEKAQREALQLAEAEQRKERARLEREAKAAAKQREAASAKSQQARLKAETKAAGLMAQLKSNAKAAPVVIKARGPAFVDGPADMSRAKITKLPTPPDRFAVTKAPSVISSGACRSWAAAVAA